MSFVFSSNAVCTVSFIGAPGTGEVADFPLEIVSRVATVADFFFAIRSRVDALVMASSSMNSSKYSSERETDHAVMQGR